MLFLAALVDPQGVFHVDNFWPVTATGWLTFFLSVAALLALIYGYAKGLTQLNGLGGRVDELKSLQTAARAREEERDKAWLQVLGTIADLQRQVGESKRAAIDCETNSEKYFIEIGSKLDEIRRDMTQKSELYVGKFASIETELRLRNQALPLYNEKK